MSDETLLHEYDSADQKQLKQNEARRMRAKVNEHRGDIHGAGNRWPFELTQNAHDPGARNGRDAVNVWLTFNGQMVVYEHDGKPFTMPELAALLSGGSSKDFEATETTGRFGTGFLVTHVLSFQINFDGVLASKHGYAKISIKLDRSGDEKNITENTAACRNAIGEAQRLAAIDSYKTARFECRTDAPEAARAGVVAFSKTVPYLYGTCEHLGCVSVCAEDGQELQFTPQNAVEYDFRGAHVRERQITVTKSNGDTTTLKAIRLRTKPHSPSSVVVILKQVDGGWRARALPEGFARLFSRFPIRASDFVPINAVIDGRFDLRQERDRVLMKESDKLQIAESVGMLPLLAELAMDKQWQDRHKLARVGMPQLAFGEQLEDPERSWWQEKLGGAAQTLAQMPIVRTTDGMLTTNGPAPCADFVLPRFDTGQPNDEFDFKPVWELASELREAHTPVLEIAPDWTSIATEWLELGVNVQRLTLTEIAKTARNGAANLDDLKVTTARLEWLARFLNVVGEVAGQHNCTAILTSLIPDQNRSLKSPAVLWRDEGIRDGLKKIAANIGHDVRSRLVLKDLVTCSQRTDLPHLRSLLDAQINKTHNESDVVEECIRELSKQLPDNKPVPAEKKAFRDGGIDLLKFLWDTLGVDAASRAQGCPLIASDNTAIRWSTQRKAMAPTSTWHRDAQNFAGLYKEDRILSGEYVTRLNGDRAVVNALVEWDIAFADPICTDMPRELRDDRLRMLAYEGQDCAGVIVAGEKVSQIALLPNELIQRCQSDKELAKLLLGLMLKHLAPNDASWREVREVRGRRQGADVPVRIRPALWLGDLRSKAWVPVQAEQGVEPVIASAGNLKELLDPAWLIANDAGVDLLSRFFGFNALELRLLSTIPSDEIRSQVESGLAKIVQALGDDPTKYSSLAADLIIQQKRQAEKEKNRHFGLGVQAVIERCLQDRGLHLTLVDCGYDYDLFVEDVSSTDAGTHHFRLADYLLEVKATTTGEVRLTPAQAQMASANLERFVLCVVDLRDHALDALQSEWSAADVAPRARVVAGIGQMVSEPHALVVHAKGCQVGLRNEAALRYGVPVAVWETGLSLVNWVEKFGLALPLSQDTSGTTN